LARGIAWRVSGQRFYEGRCAKQFTQLPGDVPANGGSRRLYLAVELRPAVHDGDYVFEVVVEHVALAAIRERVELGRAEVSGVDDAKVLPAGADFDRVIDGLPIPLIAEAEDRTVDGHDVDTDVLDDP
jgi:hypothetical protein